MAADPGSERPRGKLATAVMLVGLFRNDQTYNEQIGDAARKRLTKKEWNARVKRAVETLHALLFFDHVYIGGGNSGRVTVDLGPKASIVDNSAGILGGIALWDQVDRRERQVGGG